jgi:hypothetical protein
MDLFDAAPLFLTDPLLEEQETAEEASRCAKVLDYLEELRDSGYQATYDEVYAIVHGEDLPF